MKRTFLSGALAALGLVAAMQAQAAVSVSVGQPGFYGQIDIGDFAPQPQVIYAQPVIIQTVQAPPPPIYLRVPPGHAKRWPSYCGRYNACGVPVYFVQDTWYHDVYAPRYREHYEHEGPDHRDHHDSSHDYKGHKGKGHGKH